MKGQNVLILNQATMIEALERYLDAVTVMGVRVLSVSLEDSVSQTFRVIVQEPEPEEVKP